MTGDSQRVTVDEVEVIDGTPVRYNETKRAAAKKPRQRTIVHVGWEAKTGKWAQYAPVTVYLQALAAGNYLSAAAQIAGLSPNTTARWVERGHELAVETTGQDEPDPVDAPKFRRKIPNLQRAYVDFWAAHTRAVASAEVFLVNQWKKAATDDWRAAAELLRRRHPERWRVRDEIGIKVEETTGPSVLEIARRDPALVLELQQVAYRVAELDRPKDD